MCSNYPPYSDLRHWEGETFAKHLQSRHLWILQWFPKDYWSLMPRLTFLRFPATSSWWLIKWHFPIGTNIVQHSCLCLQSITCLSSKLNIVQQESWFLTFFIYPELPPSDSSSGAFEIPLAQILFNIPAFACNPAVESSSVCLQNIKHMPHLRSWWHKYCSTFLRTRIEVCVLYGLLKIWLSNQPEP